MNFERKHNKAKTYSKVLLLVLGIILIGLGVIYATWFWNILIIPLGIVLFISFIRGIKQSSKGIKELVFLSDELLIKYSNGKEHRIENTKLTYSLLVKKYIEPVRKIELYQSRRVKIGRRKSLGSMEIGEWPDLKPMAIKLIRSESNRIKWRFSWGIGEFLMIFSILLGAHENVAYSFVNKIKLGVSESIGELGRVRAEIKTNEIINNKDAEESFINEISE